MFKHANMKSTYFVLMAGSGCPFSTVNGIVPAPNQSSENIRKAVGRGPGTVGQITRTTRSGRPAYTTRRLRVLQRNASSAPVPVSPPAIAAAASPCGKNVPHVSKNKLRSARCASTYHGAFSQSAIIDICMEATAAAGMPPAPLLPLANPVPIALPVSAASSSSTPPDEGGIPLMLLLPPLRIVVIGTPATPAAPAMLARPADMRPPESGNDADASPPAPRKRWRRGQSGIATNSYDA